VITLGMVPGVGCKNDWEWG